MSKKTQRTQRTKSNAGKTNVVSDDATKLEATTKEQVKIVTHANNAAFSNARPGVVATILECVMNADETNAVTKNDILRVLCDRFADRDAAKMKATVMMQVPSGLRIEKRVIVRETLKLNDDKTKAERAYYVDHEATKIEQQKYMQAKIEKMQHAVKMQQMHMSKNDEMK
jgi:hypothetical protein